MKKFITISILTVFTLTGFAADLFEAKAIFTNGAIKKGYAKFPDKPEVKNIDFRSTKESEKQSINCDELSSIVYYGNSDSIIFERIATFSLWNKKKTNDPKWMVKVLKGYVTLYSYTDEGYSYFLNNSWRTWPSNSFYACKKPDEAAATIISVYAAGTVNNNATFKTYASNYFADYSDLVKKIGNKEYTYKNVIEVVEFYNQWKSKP